jgi:hypothetical protein
MRDASPCRIANWRRCASFMSGMPCVSSSSEASSMPSEFFMSCTDDASSNENSSLMHATPSLTIYLSVSS